VAARFARQPAWYVLPACLLLGFGPLLCPVFLPPVSLQAGLLAVAVLVWRLPPLRPWPFAPLACAVTLLAYGITGWFAYQDSAHLRGQFPFASLEDRLPAKPQSETAPVPSQTEQRLIALEAAFEDSRDHGWSLFRAGVLEELHEHAVEVFINRPSFGVARMSGLSERDLKIGQRGGSPLAQPGTRLPPASLAASADVSLSQAQQEKLDKELADAHRSGIVDFVHPPGFGYFRDLRHVAGFQEHQFSRAPKVEHWRLQTLDLVGLVLHEGPVVYVSDHLPRMDELRGAPTRPPDEFEAGGLKALRGGEDLYLRAGADAGRALGAVRSMKQCLSCHGGQRGDLLGAFSYTFSRERP
jgi:hypothetical protein